LFKAEILEYKNEKLALNEYNIPIYGWAKKLENDTKSFLEKQCSIADNK
jgi:hypothetical protein